MDLQTALNNINAAVRAYKGTAEEHEVLKESMQTVLDTLNRFIEKERAEQPESTEQT